MKRAYLYPVCWFFSRALGSFDSGDLSTARDHIDSLSSAGRHSFSRDPEVFPLWDPGQLLNTSQLLLLKAATSQAVDEGSDSDSVSVTSEGEYGPKYVIFKLCGVYQSYHCCIFTADLIFLHITNKSFDIQAV